MQCTHVPKTWAVKHIPYQCTDLQQWNHCQYKNTFSLLRCGNYCMPAVWIATWIDLFLCYVYPYSLVINFECEISHHNIPAQTLLLLLYNILPPYIDLALLYIWHQVLIGPKCQRCAITAGMLNKSHAVSLCWIQFGSGVARSRSQCTAAAVEMLQNCRSLLTASVMLLACDGEH